MACLNLHLLTHYKVDSANSQCQGTGQTEVVHVPAACDDVGIRPASWQCIRAAIIPRLNLSQALTALSVARSALDDALSRPFQYKQIVIMYTIFVTLLSSKQYGLGMDTKVDDIRM